MRTRFEVINPAWEKDVHEAYIALPVRQGEPVSARVAAGPQTPLLPVTVWRISPSGIEILNTTTTPMNVGQGVIGEVKIGSQTLLFKGTVRRTDPSFATGALVGINFAPDARRADHHDAAPTRKLSRWKCHPMFFPTGSLDNPGRFFDKILFRVLDISRNGIMIATSLRNKFMLRGLELQGELSIPMAESFSFRGKIVSSKVRTMNGDQCLLIGLAFKNLGRASVKALARYIMRFGSHPHQLPSPMRLKNEGYGLLQAADSVEWDYVRTQQEYLKVLQLRRIAYRSVEGWPVDDDDHLISDPFDERARIIVGRFRDTVVATMRVCFHNKDDTFEEELYITFPDDFPERDKLIEASRAAIHPDFRGNDLFMNMMRFGMLTGLQANRHWFVQSTYDYLGPIYKKCGFKEVGPGWMHPQLVGRKMQMFIVNAHHVLHARHGNPFLYNAVVPHIENFLNSEAFDNLSAGEKFKLKLWKFTAPAFRAYTQLEPLRRALKKRTKSSKSRQNDTPRRK